METETLIADYDLVGEYTQDDINGFDDSLIEKMIKYAQIEPGQKILDAMGGDGNLSYKICQYCEKNGLPIPEVTLFEYSRVQCEFAKAKLSGYPVTVIHGDILSLTDLDKKIKISTNYYDRVLIKSANHELTLEQQSIMYKNVFEMLKPSGLFINLGFTHDTNEEQREFKKIARTKDSLAGLYTMAKNRHFPTKAEVHSGFKSAGFLDVKVAEPITYTIKSDVVAQHYFKDEKRKLYEIAFQASQIRASQLRQAGKIQFYKDNSVMRLPGEITIGRKPTASERNIKIYKEYPYDFLRKIKCHRELLKSVSSLISQGTDLLDLGCGLGLLYEQTYKSLNSYTGVDLSSDFISACNQMYGVDENAMFIAEDLNKYNIKSNHFSAISLINVLYQKGIDAKKVLSSAIQGLKEDGLIFVSGPTSSNSFKEITSNIKEDLIQEGAYVGNEEKFKAIEEANRNLLSSDGNYWSAEGMSQLLLRLGCSEISHVDTTVFYKSGFLVVGRR